MNTKDWSTTKKEFESEKQCTEDENWILRKFKGPLPVCSSFSCLSVSEDIDNEENANERGSLFKGNGQEIIYKIPRCQSELTPKTPPDFYKDIVWNNKLLAALTSIPNLEELSIKEILKKLME